MQPGGGAKNQILNLNVNGTFNVASGTSYVMANNTNRNTNLNGAISIAGNITQGTSNLSIAGTGAIGTIAFTGSGGINNLTLNRGSQTLTLGSNITVNNVTPPTGGNMILNPSVETANGLPSNSKTFIVIWDLLFIRKRLSGQFLKKVRMFYYRSN